MDTDNLGSWLEKLSRKISREVEHNAIVNVRELCPASGISVVEINSSHISGFFK